MTQTFAIPSPYLLIIYALIVGFTAVFSAFCGAVYGRRLDAGGWLAFGWIGFILGGSALRMTAIVLHQAGIDSLLVSVGVVGAFFAACAFIGRRYWLPRIIRRNEARLNRSTRQD